MKSLRWNKQLLRKLTPYKFKYLSKDMIKDVEQMSKRDMLKAFDLLIDDILENKNDGITTD